MIKQKSAGSSFFQGLQEEENGGVSYRNTLLKKQILDFFVSEGNATLSDIGKKINVSIPKVNELVSELMSDGLVRDFGKVTSGVGRKPNLYGLEASSAHFLGTEVKRDRINIGLMDFSENFSYFRENIPFHLENTPECLERLIKVIENYIASLKTDRHKLLGAGINLTGRINSRLGYSYSFFHFNEEPLSKIIEQRIGVPVHIENDTRAMAFGEFYRGAVTTEKDVLFINIDEGLGMGIMIDGKLYYGKSGYAGEFGHIPLLDNDIICHCGKKGCLETTASGAAITREIRDRIQQGATSILTQKFKDPAQIKLEHIIDAALNDDMLAIELIEEAGEKIGKGVASLINLFNPELIILGGSLAKTDALIRLPIKSAINKYSLSLVHNDTELKMSKLEEKAGITGACLLVRNKLLSIHS